MKKLMNLIGLVAAILTVTGLLFKFLHLQGAASLFNYGFLGITLVYLPMLAITRYRSISGEVVSERLKLVFGFLSAILIGVGVLLKLNQLGKHGGTVMLLGSAMVILAYLPLLFFSRYKKSAN